MKERTSGRHHCVCRVDTRPRPMVRYCGSTGGQPYWRCQVCKRLEFGMPPQTLLLGVVGSTAYGLDGPGSDLDYLGIFQEPTRNLVGLTSPMESVVTHHPTDKTLHEVGKFIRLALAGNPTVNELLWLDSYLQTSIGGDLLLSIRHAFLSNKMRATYGGYARQQALRLARGEVESNQRKRIEKHGRHCFRLMLQGQSAVETGELRVRLTSAERAVCFAMGRLAAKEPETFQREVEAQMAEFDSVTSVLPPRPDYEAAEKVLLNIRADGSLGC